MIADTTIKRPALRYYGGKWNLAPWIISYFPPHKNYVEPCGGAASVLLQKPRSLVETYNDLDGIVCNFFRVLRDRPDELIRKIQLTPWAREEYDLGFYMLDNTDDLEKARLFFMVQWMGINSATTRTASSHGWRAEATDLKGRIIHDIDMFHSDSLYDIAGRFKYVQIENDTMLNVIDKFNHPEALVYFDPPYVEETRNKNNWYAVDQNDNDHFEAAERLRKFQGYVVISGYACPLYADLYESHGWKRVDRMAQTNSGGKRVESLWLNPRCWQSQQQKTLFDTAE